MNIRSYPRLTRGQRVVHILGASLLGTVLLAGTAAAQDDVQTFRDGLAQMSATYTQTIAGYPDPASDEAARDASRKAADGLRATLLGVTPPECLQDAYVAAWVAYAALDWRADDEAAHTLVARAFDELNALILKGFC